MKRVRRFVLWFLGIVLFFLLAVAAYVVITASVEKNSAASRFSARATHLRAAVRGQDGDKKLNAIIELKDVQHGKYQVYKEGLLWALVPRELLQADVTAELGPVIDDLLCVLDDRTPVLLTARVKGGPVVAREERTIGQEADYTLRGIIGFDPEQGPQSSSDWRDWWARNKSRHWWKGENR